MRKLMRATEPPTLRLAAHLLGYGELKLVEECFAQRLNCRIVTKAALLEDLDVRRFDESTDRIVAQVDGRFCTRQEPAQILGRTKVEIIGAAKGYLPAVFRDCLGTVRHVSPIGLFPKVQMRSSERHSRHVGSYLTISSGTLHIFLISL